MYENHPVQAREFRDGAKSSMPGPNENPVTTARNKIADLEGRVSFLREQVERVANVQLGAEQPSPATSVCSPQAPREGEAGRLHDDLDGLNWSIARLEAQVMRLAPLSVQMDAAGPSLRRIA